MNIAVFCSGNGSNFQAIVDGRKKGLFKADIVLMVCDNPKAYAIKRAEAAGIRPLVIALKDFPAKKDYEARIIAELRKERVDLICLAGYMKLVSADFVKIFKERIINIHPAILPAFKGAHGIKDAFDYGAKITGVTVHFVDADMDAGPIILQESLKIEESDTEDMLARKIHKIEHILYPQAIKLFTEGRLEIIGRKVRIRT